jgi:alpha-mannosidase
METPDGSDPAPPEPTVGFRVVSLLHDDGKEPASGLTDGDASAAWCAATAPWHPALLAQADEVPGLEDVAAPSDPRPGEVRLVAAGRLDRLPPGYRDRAEAVGVPIVEASEDRLATVWALLARSPDPLNGADPADALSADYLALGAAHWWLRDLTNAMGHADTLSRTALAREVLAGARAWHAGDPTAATNRLRAAFELITEARERFYPMDGYILDLCLLDPATPPDALAGVLENHTPFTLVASARAIEVFAEREPERAARFREAVSEGWADVVGGAYDEVDEPFHPWSSIAWQFRQGSEVYRRHLDDRNVETLARRRFGLYPQLPQIARRFGLRFAFFVALDSGRFPVHPEAKRLWAAPDGTTLESITRPPIAADRPAEGARLAWRIGKSMRDDVVATLALAHWPGPVAPWFADFRRTAAYSPVLSRWVTINDFFHRSDRPFEEITPALDDFAPAYLDQAAARRDPSPIAARAAHARLRARLDALIATHALASALAGTEAEPLDPGLEEWLETGRRSEADAEIARRLPLEAAALAHRIVGDGTTQRPGYLVLNPLGVSRRVAVLLPDASADLRPDGPLRAAQLTEEGVWAVVDLPPFGFAWVAGQSDPDRPAPAPVPGVVSIRDRTIANESMSVAIDPTTGGIRSIQSRAEETPRLGQQLAIAGLVSLDGKPAPSRMRGTSFRADYGGPALAQATTTGTIHDPSNDRRLASFEQRFRLWAGRPTLEIRITLSDLDPDWLDRLAGSDPWGHYLACRWAWPDPQSALRRTALLAPTSTEAERPETPDALDITSRQRRTTLLFGGLAHHRRHGSRMLDTLLVAGSESSRTFDLGVTLELEHPFPAALDLTAPALVVPTGTGPPRSGPAGWLLQVDHKSVAILRLAFEPRAGDGQGWGLVADLIETAGQPARCRLRAFRDPTQARQVDGHGEHVIDLSIDRDAAMIDLTPHEIARVELTLG